MFTRISISLILLFSIQFVYCGSVIGATEEETLEQACKADPYLCKEKDRFTTHQPNYAIWQWTNGDNDAVEVNYSFKYMLTPPDCVSAYRYNDGNISDALECLGSYRKRVEIYFKYTGMFDFYMFTRDSDPVINRVSNPALHVRKYLGRQPGALFEWIDVGLQHRSDGQTVDVDEVVTDPASADFGRYWTQVEYERGNYEYFDALSRGANYISIATKLKIGIENLNEGECDRKFSCLDMWVSIKPVFLSHDSNITWGPLANTDVGIADYDRYRMGFSDTFSTGFPVFPEIEVAGEWTLGDELLDTDSLNFSLFFPIVTKWIKVPFFVRVHVGPMSTLSDYTRDQNSIGIGLKFQ